MDFLQLVTTSRSYRRFYENEPISRETLRQLVNYARLAPSGSNRQALKYYVACDKELNDKIFPTLLWAMYLKDWPGPEAGERPAAYIVIVQDENYKMAAGIDHGIAVQTIMLGAAQMGLGGCMFANIYKDKLREALGIPETQEILLAIALGKPKETVVIDEIGPDGDIKYWRDENQVHHVPKRKLDDIILN
ncbi:MAG: nitroreductase family protein [Negativicutes bacterium]|nr:nitroreductase family protein [Negativicutes bacterium]